MSALLSIPDGEPVVVRRIEVRRDPWVVIVYGSNGELGYCVGSPRMPDIFSLLQRRVAPFFLGRNARDIESLIDEIYTWRTNYKYDSMPFWCGVAHLEMAILDLLGRSYGCSIAEFFGGRRTDRVPVYLSSLRRDTTPEEEVDYVCRRLEETGSTACKVKIGGRMSRNADAAPGRTEALVTLLRRRLASETEAYVDANSTYTPERAVEVGTMLQDHAIDLFEEPVPWLDFEGTKRVADALEIPVSACEQDYDTWKIEWFVRNRGVDVVQPDVFYLGGIVRTLRVAAFAAHHDMPVMPHSPHTDATAAGMLHVVSIIPNAGRYNEFRIEEPEPTSWCSASFRVSGGAVDVPTGPGLGIQVDLDWIRARDLALALESE